MLQAEADVGVGGEMKNDVAAGHRRGQRRHVEDIAFHQFEFGMLERAREKFAQAGAEIIEAGDGKTRREQAIGKIAADETGSAGDERFPV